MSTASTNPGTGRVPEIDGLRGMAIFLVVCWHYLASIATLDSRSWFYLPRAAWSPLWFAWSGVDLFFVLSGYLIVGILLDTRESPVFFKIFYTRRLARILPLYFAVIALYALAVASFDSGGLALLSGLLREPRPPLWSYLTFTQNLWMVTARSFGPVLLGVTWSLAVEEQFYVTAPAVVRWTSRGMFRWLLVGCVVGSPLLRTGLLLRFEMAPWWNYLLLPCRVDALALGAGIALAQRNPAMWAKITGSHRAVLGVTVASAVMLVGMLVAGSRLYSPLMTSVGHSVLAVFYGSLLVWVLTRPTGVMAGVFRLSALQEMGRLCYGIYLFHEGMLGLCHGVVFGRRPHLENSEDLAITALAFLLTLMLAKVSWRYLEGPIIRWSHGASRQNAPTSPKPSLHEGEAESPLSG